MDQSDPNVKRYIYNRIAIELDREILSDDIDDFRAKVQTFMSSSEWEQWVSGVVNRCESALGVAVDSVTIQPHKFKMCIVCNRLFYDTSRNGKVLTCPHVPSEKGKTRPECELKLKATHQRRFYNRHERKEDTDDYLSYQYPRYSVRRINKTINGIPIEKYMSQ